MRLSETYLLVGRLAEAQALATCVLALTQTQGERGNRAWVLLLLGTIAVCRQPWDAGEAERYHRQARPSRAGPRGPNRRHRPLPQHGHDVLAA